MGLFSKIKNKLGIGGVKVSVQVPGHVPANVNQVSGKVELSSKSEQEIIEIEIKFIEEFTTGRGDDKKTKTFDLGVVKFHDTFTIKPGEIKNVDFELPFQLIKSNADSLKEKGGALGALGKMGKFANNEKSAYFVEANVDVKSAILDPTDKKEVNLVVE